MGLMQKIDQDLKAAMAAKDAVRLSTLRFLKSALAYGAIEKKVEMLGDAEVLQIIRKQIKQHRESIDQFAKAGRKELAEKEQKETVILESYLPPALSDEVLEKAVASLVKEVGAASKKDFGKVMKLSMEKLGGQADAQRVSQILGRMLP
ncbi:MAG: GatB/YqeY domain-containing protein [Candidatus Omnitrophica bacterium]|nr:GatB/YqeY domain-containing protein [Candidatus Omnitrophota bacterium]